MKAILQYYSARYIPFVGRFFSFSAHVNVCLPDCNKIINSSIDPDLAGVFDVVQYPWQPNKTVEVDVTEAQIAELIRQSEQPLQWYSLPWRNCYTIVGKLKRRHPS